MVLWRPMLLHSLNLNPVTSSNIPLNHCHFIRGCSPLTLHCPTTRCKLPVHSPLERSTPGWAIVSQAFLTFHHQMISSLYISVPHSCRHTWSAFTGELKQSLWVWWAFTWCLCGLQERGGRIPHWKPLHSLSVEGSTLQGGNTEESGHQVYWWSVVQWLSYREGLLKHPLFRCVAISLQMRALCWACTEMFRLRDNI